MSTWKLVRLQFGRGVAHFGELGIGLEEANERVRSDTLFSAWLSACARLFPKEVEDIIQKNKQPDPLFRISSAFIYQYFNGKIVEYLPRPLKFPKKYPIGNDFEFAKTFKKLRYLPRDVWQRWYQGEGFEPTVDRLELIDATQKNESGALTEAGTFAYSQAFKIQKQPKVSIDRTTRATNFYHTGMVGFRWEFLNGSIQSLSGLYCLVEFPTDDKNFERRFFDVLDFLGSEGLGGERSSGAGQFNLEVLDLDPAWTQLTQFSKGTQNCLISLFWQPHISPAMMSQASYELKERSGWITAPGVNSQRRRRAVQMFTEGSVFTGNLAGELADVTPRNAKDEKIFTKHDIYRSGIALSLPIQV